MSLGPIDVDFDFDEWFRRTRILTIQSLLNDKGGDCSLIANGPSRILLDQKIREMLFAESSEKAHFQNVVGGHSQTKPQFSIGALRPAFTPFDLIALYACKSKPNIISKAISKAGEFIAEHRTEIIVGAVICITGVGIAYATGYSLSVVIGGVVVAGTGSILTFPDKKIPLPNSQPASKQEKELYGQPVTSQLPALDLPPSPNQFYVSVNGVWSNGEFYPTNPLTQSPDTNSGTTWQNFASYNFLQQITESPTDAASYRARAQNALVLGNYPQAAHDFGKAIEVDPTNTTTCLEQATALFNLEEYDASLEGYQKAASEPQPLSVSEFSVGFAKGLPKGVYESGEGMLLFFAEFVKHPIQTSKQMIDTIGTLVELARTDQWGVIGEALSPEIHQLVTEWDSLTSEQRGELAGYALGKIGSDILVPGALSKVASKSVKSAEELVAICKNIKIAQETVVLEAATEIGSSIKIAEVVQMSKKTTQLAEECGISASEMGQLKQAGKLESTVATGAERFTQNPALRESYELFYRAQKFLKPYTKEFMSEEKCRELIHSTGIRTFPRPEGIPENYLVMLSDTGAGMKYVNPENNEICVRVMPGKPHSPNPSQQKPYIIQQVNGKAFDKDGNLMSPSSPEAHVPVEEFTYRGCKI